MILRAAEGGRVMDIMGDYVRFESFYSGCALVVAPEAAL